MKKRFAFLLIIFGVCVGTLFNPSVSVVPKVMAQTLITEACPASYQSDSRFQYSNSSGNILQKICFAAQNSKLLIQFTDSSATDPSIVSSSAQTSGMWFFGGNPAFSTSGVGRMFMTTVQMQLKSDFPICWSSGSLNGSTDLCFSRSSANQLSVGSNTTVGDSTASMNYRQWNSNGLTFSGLGSPSNGSQVYCSDCNIANPCTSGGTGAFAKRLNGAWVCN